MHRPYEVYKKHQYLLKVEAKREVAARRSCSPSNCKYNKRVPTDKGHIVQICSFERNMSTLTVCDSNACASQCSAYAPLYLTDSQALNAWVQEIADPKIKMQRYPAISALEWVMANHLHELKNTKWRWYQRVLFKVIEWLEKIAERTPLNSNTSEERTPSNVNK